MSTMYSQRWQDRDDLSPFFNLGKKMGFGSFELSHIVTSAALDALDPGAARIVSVHHPCPAGTISGEDQLTSADRDCRRRAEQGLRRSMHTARRVEAEAVVLHLGPAGATDSGIRQLAFELLSRYQAGQRSSERYGDLLERISERLDRCEPEIMEKAAASLRSLAEEAASLGIRLGLETAYYPYELPRPVAMGQLLDYVGNPSLGAWLDTGHVAAQENLGLQTFDEWQRVVGGRWIGAHLHDIVGVRDHLVPGMGELSFSDIVGHMPTDVQLTLEVDYYFEPDEVTAGLDHLRTEGILYPE
jgi:sugar phosphate isomerase/epimerase